MSENGHGNTNAIELPQTITVRELALAIEASPIDVIKILMANGSWQISTNRSISILLLLLQLRWVLRLLLENSRNLTKMMLVKSPLAALDRR